MLKSTIIVLLLGAVIALWALPKKEAQSLIAYYSQYKKDFLVCEGNTCRIASDKHDKSRTVSEGQGYGMLIVASMAAYDKEAQKIFDRLFYFAKAHPSTIEKDLMTWQVPEVKGESDSAFDGDADIAYALLIASKIWGDKGDIHYKKEALKIINTLSKKVLGADSYLPLLGDWVEQNGKKYNQYTTRTSDFMPGHFRAFYRVSGDRRWLKAVEATQKALLAIQALPENKTALVSDFIYHDKRGYHPTKRHFLEEEDDSYYYNACRVPWRIGVDALLNDDKTSQKIALKMLAWMAEKSHQKAEGIKSGYHLTGEAIGADYTTAAFVAPFGVAAKLDKRYEAFLDDIYAHIKTAHENYFEDSINLLCQLAILDMFKDPTTVK